MEKRIEYLIARIRLGNAKLTTAWKVVCEQDDPEGFKRLAAQWDEANKKLNTLCLELMALDYQDCLYIQDGIQTKKCLGGEFTCWVCPSKISYWRQEFEEL